jgi:hypothetical protein
VRVSPTGRKASGGDAPAGRSCIRAIRLASGLPDTFSFRFFVILLPAMKSSASTATFPQPEIGRAMNGADVVVESLHREGVDVIFAYPGGASQELHQAFARSDKVRVILPRHEQGGVFAAEAWSRANGKVGVCMATSGPGATNLVSGIADAFMDSIPLICITGQVFSKYIGKSAFQETDFFGMTLPIVKHSYLVLNAADLDQDRGVVRALEHRPAQRADHRTAAARECAMLAASGAMAMNSRAFRSRMAWAP